MNLVDLSDIPEKTKVLIAEYISDNQQLLFASQNYKISQFTQNLSNIDIKFKEYIYRDDIYDKRILDYTYQNNLYLISKANIRFFVDFYSKKDVSEDEFVHKNFELLNTNIELKPLLDYCLSSEEKLVQYVNLYIKLSSGKMDDHPSYIERLLNHDILFQNRDAENEVITLAEAIFNSIPKFSIDYTVDKFKELSDENKLELINYLVLKQTAKVNSEVVLIYFNNAELIDNYLIDFINHDPSFKLKKIYFCSLIRTYKMFSVLKLYLQIIWN